MTEPLKESLMKEFINSLPKKEQEKAMNIYKHYDNLHLAIHDEGMAEIICSQMSTTQITATLLLVSDMLSLRNIKPFVDPGWDIIYVDIMMHDYLAKHNEEETK